MANDFIQCRKVAEHVVEKIVGGGDVNGASGGGRSEQDSGNDAPEERIELLCCDQVWHKCRKIYLSDARVSIITTNCKKATFILYPWWSTSKKREILYFTEDSMNKQKPL